MNWQGRDVPDIERERIERATRWAAVPLAAAVRFALGGPAWMPRVLRRLPLLLVTELMRLQVVAMGVT